MSDTDGATKASEEVDSQHWFADKEIDVLLYRVNRRPLLAGTLFADALEAERPPDVLVHLQENILEHDPTTESGRRFKRTWQIGNVAVDLDARILTGRLGWRRSGEELATDWDAAAREWIDRVVPGDRSAVSPFAFVADGRYVGVLKHSSFTEQTIAQVLTALLNRAEKERAFPTTDWDVEPVGDASEFYDWLAATDRVTKLELVFKRPNPDAEPAFAELFARLDAMRADSIREIITTKAEDGLNKEAVRTEPVTQAFITAAMVAFGYLVGRGVNNGRKVTYDQRKQVARERILGVSPTWQGATQQVLTAVRQAIRRHRSNE